MCQTVMTSAMRAEFHTVVTEGGARPMSKESSDAMAIELAAVIDEVLAEEASAAANTSGTAKGSHQHNPELSH